VKYNNWIEELYYKEFLVNKNNKEYSDGRIQIKRKNSKAKEGNKGNSK
tara:strand:- start:1129 stop:1272 length:144 start_codon:yes stop_codon:yes gene_type:complete